MTDERKRLARFDTEHWEPPERDIDAVMLFGSDEAELSILGEPSTGIRTDEIVHLSDKV